jgi:hypothetical protein
VHCTAGARLAHTGAHNALPQYFHVALREQLLTLCASIVSWSWGSGQPGGKVAEVKEQGEIAIESNRGNTIKKNASPDNPAVHIERSGNDVVKRASELQVDSKAEGTNGTSHGDSKKENDKPAEPEKEEKPAESEKKDEEMKDAPSTEEKKEDVQTNGDSKEDASKDDAKEDSKDEDKTADASKDTSEDKTGESKTGDKRKADETPSKETNGADAGTDEPAAKKAKKDDDAGETKGKKGGRPKKEKKEPAKKKQPKKAATADGQPRRSGRNKA